MVVVVAVVAVAVLVVAGEQKTAREREAAVDHHNTHSVLQRDAVVVVEVGRIAEELPSHPQCKLRKANSEEEERGIDLPAASSTG